MSSEKDESQKMYTRPVKKGNDHVSGNPDKIRFPMVVCGTSTLGNLYEELPIDRKQKLVETYINCFPSAAVFDSAGKYGAGLALEVLGRSLAQLNVRPENILISNKLGWFRTNLSADEPTFEKGIWKNIRHDAVQKISYDGILECYEQGNALLGRFKPALASVHDPDEYLAAAKTDGERRQKLQDIIGAYRALKDLKSAGKISLVGIGAKDWKIMREISGLVELDWVMLANSMTAYHHPEALLGWISELKTQKIRIINSAVFNGGFLVGSSYFNYRPVSPNDANDLKLIKWREDFFEICRQHDVPPAHACIQFGISIPGVESIALNSTSEKRIKENVEMASTFLPTPFWTAMKNAGLIDKSYPYLG